MRDFGVLRLRSHEREKVFVELKKVIYFNQS